MLDSLGRLLKVSYAKSRAWYSKLNTSARTIVSIIAIVTIWMLSGSFRLKHEIKTAEVKIASVKTEESIAKERAIEITYNGSTQAIKIVTLKPETDGNIKEIYVRDGSYVRKGELIATIDEKAYNDLVRQAQADLDLQRISFKSAKAIFDKNLSSEIALATAEANLKGAEAKLAQAKESLNQTHILAPFDGFIDDIVVEVGDFISVFLNNSIGIFSDLSKLKAVIFIPQKEIEKINNGDTGIISVRNKTFIGELNFLSQVANAQTRSFRAEVVFDNPNFLIKSGESVVVKIQPAKPLSLHYIKKSTIGIDISGEILIKTLEEGNKVKSYKVSIEDEDEQGFWVSGLPEKANIITLGHPYVIDGEIVETHVH